jgi:hypothetical protein
MGSLAPQLGDRVTFEIVANYRKEKDGQRCAAAHGLSRGSEAATDALAAMARWSRIMPPGGTALRSQHCADRRV